MAAFRPISLCNVIYKIVSKVLANQWKVALPAVVLLNQSAFISGRLFSDNVLTAFELFHYMKNKRQGKGHFALKLDMSKAYDRVEWEFLRGVMYHMVFHHDFIYLIVHCITTVSFSSLSCVRKDYLL